MIKRITLGVVALSSLGAMALAHNGATGVVMERMMGMSAMRSVMKELAPMMQGQVTYDELAVRDAAMILQSHAGENLAQLFPEEPVPQTSFAKSEIWTDWDQFKALSEDLRLYSEGLAIAAVNGIDVPQPAVTPFPDDGPVLKNKDAIDPSLHAFTVEELLGLVEPANATSLAAAKVSPQGGKFAGIDFEAAGAAEVFEKISQTCASCHSLYRKGE